MLVSSKSPIYTNNTVLCPRGRELFKCGNKKYNWYLDRHLAIEVLPGVIQLTFEPKGDGWLGDDFYLQDRKNICVVCGSEDDLSKHHVVPFCYRKWMDEEIKNRGHHDVLPVCIDCHEQYERDYAWPRKNMIARTYKVPIHPDVDGDRARNYARAILRHGDKIPDDKFFSIIEWIENYLGKWPLNEDLIDLSERKTITHGQIVINKLNEKEIEKFIFGWRQHFVDTMNPEFLPSGWKINKKVC